MMPLFGTKKMLLFFLVLLLFPPGALPRKTSGDPSFTLTFLKAYFCTGVSKDRMWATQIKDDAVIRFLATIHILTFCEEQTLLADQFWSASFNLMHKERGMVKVCTEDLFRSSIDAVENEPAIASLFLEMAQKTCDRLDDSGLRNQCHNSPVWPTLEKVLEKRNKSRHRKMKRQFSESTLFNFVTANNNKKFFNMMKSMHTRINTRILTSGIFEQWIKVVRCLAREWRKKHRG